LFIDNRSLMTIIDTEMDYEDDEIVSEFVFNNPNSRGKCGCGESFKV
jgi:iron-sulfur cluster assembly accessory protein